MTVSLLILLLSTGCPLIHEYSLLCAATASALRLLSTWLNSWRFTDQPARYALLMILPFFVFTLGARTRLVRDLFLVLHLLSGTVSLSKLDRQRHSQLSSRLWNLTSSSYPVDSWLRVYVHTHSLKSVLVYWFVMGHVLQFGETARKKVHYY